MSIFRLTIKIVERYRRSRVTSVVSIYLSKLAGIFLLNFFLLTRFKSNLLLKTPLLLLLRHKLCENRRARYFKKNVLQEDLQDAYLSHKTLYREGTLVPVPCFML